MGYSVSAFLVAGVKTTREALHEDVKIRGCEHQVSGQSKFCPECGKPTWKIERVPLGGFDGYDKYKHLPVHGAVSSECDDVIVGKTIGVVGKEPFFVDTTAAQKAADDIRASLKDDPILDVGPFGIWMCLYESI